MGPAGAFAYLLDDVLELARETVTVGSVSLYDRSVSVARSRFVD